MRRALAAAILAAASVPAAGMLASPCAASAGEAGRSRAGLVVQFGDLSAREFCVSFTEDHLSGFELLRRSGLDLVWQDYGGDAVTVCRIAGEGCDYPRQPCFCQCRSLGATCAFWGYYRIDRSTGIWRFSQAGPGGTTVRDGDVDGWRWGQHGAQGVSPPPPDDLGTICARGTHVAPPQAREEPSPRASVLGERVERFPGPSARSTGTGVRAQGDEPGAPRARSAVDAAASKRKPAPPKGAGRPIAVGSFLALLGAIALLGARIGRARRRSA